VAVKAPKTTLWGKDLRRGLHPSPEGLVAQGRGLGRGLAPFPK